MLLSRPCHYAVLAMAYLAGREPGALTSIREIGERAGVPLPFLSKILSTLARHGLVTSRRGPRGGVALARPADRVSVGDIVEVIDGSASDPRCVLGLEGCSDRDPCPVHESWKPIRKEIHRALHARVLSDLTKVGSATRAGKTRRRRKKRAPG